MTCEKRGSLSEQMKKRRRERIGPVTAYPDNLENNKEVGGEHKVPRALVKVVQVERVCPLCRV